MLSRHQLRLLPTFLAAGCVAGTEPEPTNPLPLLERLTPAALTVMSGAQTVTLVGESFVEGASAFVNGDERPAEFSNSGTLQLPLVAGDLASAGELTISVRNPEPGGGRSSELALSVETARPTIDSLTPPGAAAVVSAGLTLRVFGSGFTDYGIGSRVYASEASVPTTYVSPGELEASLPPHLLQRGGALAVSVENPAPGGGMSTPVSLSVENPTPIIASISPDSVPLGSAATITVRGTGLVPGMTAWMDSIPYAPSSSNSSTLIFTVPRSAPQRGGARIWIENPSPGGGRSNALTIGVQEVRPTVLATIPAGVEVGAAVPTLVVVGRNFAPDATLTLDGVERSVNRLSTDSLVVTLSGQEIASPGTIEVGVTNPRGGGPSTPLEVSIVPAGVLVYNDGTSNLVTSRLNGTDRQIFNVGRTPGSPQAWPVGDTILYPKVGLPGIFRTVMGGAEVTILATDPLADAYKPRISRDRQWIYFGFGEIKRVRPDGSDVEVVIANPPAGVLNRWPEPSPSGDRISYARYQNDLPASIRDDLQILDLATLQVTSLGVLAHDSRWSPDGQWLAYRTVFGELRLIRPDGTGDREVFGPLRTVAEGQFGWSPDSRYLLASLNGTATLREIDTGLEVALPLGTVRSLSWFPAPN